MLYSSHRLPSERSFRTCYSRILDISISVSRLLAMWCSKSLHQSQDSYIIRPQWCNANLGHRCSTAMHPELTKNACVSRRPRCESRWLKTPRGRVPAQCGGESQRKGSGSSSAISGPRRHVDGFVSLRLMHRTRKPFCFESPAALSAARTVVSAETPRWPWTWRLGSQSERNAQVKDRHPEVGNRDLQLGKPQAQVTFNLTLVLL
jgi:hypothetical protein